MTERDYIAGEFINSLAGDCPLQWHLVYPCRPADEPTTYHNVTVFSITETADGQVEVIFNIPAQAPDR